MSEFRWSRSGSLEVMRHVPQVIEVSLGVGAHPDLSSRVSSFTLVPVILLPPVLPESSSILATEDSWRSGCGVLENVGIKSLKILYEIVLVYYEEGEIIFQNSIRG